MYDRQTDSLWTHVTGTADHGELKGKHLEIFPSLVTTWESWKRSYPHTKVLSGYTRRGFMGTFIGLENAEGAYKEIGLSVVINFEAKLYPIKALMKQSVVNDTFEKRSILVTLLSPSKTATVWDRNLAGKVLSFKKSHKKDPWGNSYIKDQKTGSLWSAMTGEAVEGPLKKKHLKKITGHPILIERFKYFYPEGPVY